VLHKDKQGQWSTRCPRRGSKKIELLNRAEWWRHQHRKPLPRSPACPHSGPGRIMIVIQKSWMRCTGWERICDAGAGQ